MTFSVDLLKENRVYHVPPLPKDLLYLFVLLPTKATSITLVKNLCAKLILI